MTMPFLEVGFPMSQEECEVGWGQIADVTLQIVAGGG
jgi:hypothetical protein